MEIDHTQCIVSQTESGKLLHSWEIVCPRWKSREKSGPRKLEVGQRRLSLASDHAQHDETAVEDVQDGYHFDTYFDIEFSASRSISGPAETSLKIARDVLHCFIKSQIYHYCLIKSIHIINTHFITIVVCIAITRGPAPKVGQM